MNVQNFVIHFVLASFGVMFCESLTTRRKMDQEELNQKRKDEIYARNALKKIKNRSCEQWIYNDQEKLLKELFRVKSDRMDFNEPCQDLDVPVFYYLFLSNRLLLSVEKAIQIIYQAKEDDEDSVYKMMDPRKLVHIFDSLTKFSDMEPYFAKRYQWEDDESTSRARSKRSTRIEC